MNSYDRVNRKIDEILERLERIEDRLATPPSYVAPGQPMKWIKPPWKREMEQGTGTIAPCPDTVKVTVTNGEFVFQ